jgi:hypothetical protein
VKDTEEVEHRLRAFVEENRKFRNQKGALSLALVITRRAREEGLPLDPDSLLTEGGGQVKGLGGGATNKILKEHGVGLTLAEEGGRTNRGSIANMRAYVTFLGVLYVAKLHSDENLQFVERWWIDRIHDYFASKPLSLKLDAAKSLRYVVRDLLKQAEKRQRERGVTFVGTVLQHLVGAKLEVLMPDAVEHHGANVADEGAGRAGDFLVGDVAIHVTTTPSEGLLRKCADNLGHGLRPMIVTTQTRAAAADQLAEVAGIADRVDVFDAEQFLAGNVYELGEFHAAGRRATVDQLAAAYNSIVDEHETDPSLRIEVD